MSEFNIIIPSITIDSRLIRCLRGISKLNYKNFFVTLVLDNKKNVSLLGKFKFKINILILNKVNMSKKRNKAAKKYRSKYLAFIDSDACPNKYWLTFATKEFKNKKLEVVGGPNLPFKNQNFWQKITYFCKRSFFVTAHYNFINYMSKNRYCDLLHSSNFIIKRKSYFSVNGMNENLYIGEDHDFFYRLNKRFKNIKIFFSKKIYVYHEDREFNHFLLQRFCYGLNVFTSKNTKIKRSLAIIPFLMVCLFWLFILNISTLSLIIFCLVLLFTCLVVFWEVSRFIDSLTIKFLMVFSICLVNISYGLGTLFYFFGVRNLIEKKIYRNIKKV
jgi:hypothetical protein